MKSSLANQLITKSASQLKFFASFCCLTIAISSSAQLKWWKAPDSLSDGLPASVKIFYTNDSLEGKPFIAYYIEAELKDKKLNFTTQAGNGKRLTPAQFYESEKRPLVVVNGTFFSFQTNQNLNVLMRNGKLKAYNVTSLKGRGKDSTRFYYITRSAIGIDKKRNADVAWIFTDSSKRHPYAFEDSPVVAIGRSKSPNLRSLQRFDYNKWRMRTAIGGGPALIHDGQIKITNKPEQMFVSGEKDKHPRTAMGYTKNGKLIILVIQGRFPGKAEGATLQQEAQILYDLGCYEALNLDGGGSSCMLVNGKETIKPSDTTGQRPVPGVFIINSKIAQ
ncbi:MAG: phosphodiester glycosidase family protein [Chitinophagaceae bacterium]